MRYTYHSWNDVDRALESFKYARRALLVVLGLALPFAAWDVLSSPQPTAQGQVVEVNAVKQVRSATPSLDVIHVHPESACAPRAEGGRSDDVPV